MEKSYKDYVKPELIKKFEKLCEINSKDFYSCGTILTAHLVMEALMQHTFKGIWKKDKATSKEAWEDALKQTDYHSGMSAAITATMIAKFSPRGEEFKNWCIKDDVVMVGWEKKSIAQKISK